mgnify:CR=1 FL=1
MRLNWKHLLRFSNIYMIQWFTVCIELESVFMYRFMWLVLHFLQLKLQIAGKLPTWMISVRNFMHLKFVTKVIIDESRGEVPLLEQDTILILSNFLVWMLQCMSFKKLEHFFCHWKHEKNTLKGAHNQPRPFFSVLPISPNPAQISLPVP